MLDIIRLDEEIRKVKLRIIKEQNTAAIYGPHVRYRPQVSVDIYFQGEDLSPKSSKPGLVSGAIPPDVKKSKAGRLQYFERFGMPTYLPTTRHQSLSRPLRALLRYSMVAVEGRSK